MASRIIVREADKEDIEKIVPLLVRLKALNEEIDPHYKAVDNLEEAARKYLETLLDRSDARVIVAVDADTGDIAGVIIYSLVDRVFYEPRIKAVITDFYVHPRYRRKRVGSLLLDKAAERAASDGAGILTAVYPAGNAIAENFYKSRKFVPLQVEVYRPL